MESMDGDPLGGGAGGRREPLAKILMGGVADTNLIDRTQHNRLVGSDEHDSSTTERSLDGRARIIGKGTADRRRGIDVKDADAERRCGLARGDGCQQAKSEDCDSATNSDAGRDRGHNHLLRK